MSVSEPFIRRPIATSLLGVALLIGGALGYFALPVLVGEEISIARIADVPIGEVLDAIPLDARALHRLSQFDQVVRRWYRCEQVAAW